MLPLLLIGPGRSWPAYLGAVTLIGAGSGLVTPPIQASAVLAVAPARAGHPAGFFSTMRYVGSITGATAMGALLTDRQPSPASFQLLYGLLVVAAVAAVLVCRRLPGPPTRRRVATATDEVTAV